MRSYKQLTLFHAFIVMYLKGILWYHMPTPRTLAYLISTPERPWPRDVLGMLVTFVFFVFPFLFFMLYVGFTYKTVGSQPECDDIVENGWLGYKEGVTYNLFRTEMLSIMPHVGFLLVRILWRINMAEFKWIDYIAYKTCSRIAACIFYTIASTACIIRVKLLIGKNPVSEEEKQWTFGQVLAMFLLLGPSYQFIKAFVDRKESRPVKHLKDLDHNGLGGNGENLEDDYDPADAMGHRGPGKRVQKDTIPTEVLGHLRYVMPIEAFYDDNTFVRLTSECKGESEHYEYSCSWYQCQLFEER